MRDRPLMACAQKKWLYVELSIGRLLDCEHDINKDMQGLTTQHIVKKSIICKHIKDYWVRSDINSSYVPSAGDVAIFRVRELGKHTAIQGATGHLRSIFPGDLIVAVFGNRYATSQIEGYVPEVPAHEYHILGMGGVVGIVASMHERLEDIGPTTLELVGYATDEAGTVLNSKFIALPRRKFNVRRRRKYTTVLSLGSGMDSGKTTTAGFLCRGLRRAGKRPVYMKLTGTVYTKDLRFALDCGAVGGIDFSAAGFPSTYLCDLQELKDLYATLTESLEVQKPDTIVIEIADGLLQRETKMLIEDRNFMSTIDHIMFSAEDSMSVIRGKEMLTALGKSPIALSGLFTTAPLLRKEVEANTNIPVLNLEELEHIGEHALIRLFHAENELSSIRSKNPLHAQVDINRRLPPHIQVA